MSKIDTFIKDTSFLDMSFFEKKSTHMLSEIIAFKCNSIFQCLNFSNTQKILKYNKTVPEADFSSKQMY